MLPAAHRLRTSSDFSQVVRRGRRAGRPTLTVHLLEAATAGGAGSAQAPAADTEPPALIGLVVSKAVGGSVVRHQVARRLRHLLRARLVLLPVGSKVVVRASASAGTASSAQLGADLDRALIRLTGAGAR